jgi:hypothetical protein
MANKRGSALNAALDVGPKKHFCPAHGEECKAVQFRPARGQARIRFNCPGKDGDGAHSLAKGATALK